MTDQVELDVHTEHCCVIHGCKYFGDEETCPVISRQKLQSFLCEYCDEERDTDSWVHSRAPWEHIPHLDKEPGWFVLSSTQITPWNHGAEGKAVMTSQAMKILLGHRYINLLQEIDDKGSGLVEQWFTNPAVYVKLAYEEIHSKKCPECGHRNAPYHKLDGGGSVYCDHGEYVAEDGSIRSPCNCGNNIGR